MAKNMVLTYLHFRIQFHSHWLETGLGNVQIFAWSSSKVAATWDEKNERIQAGPVIPTNRTWLQDGAPQWWVFIGLDSPHENYIVTSIVNH